MGKFNLTGIAPAPRGVPQIEVTFDMDTNGILNVQAEDKGSGRKNKITITNDSNRLTADQIKKMVNDAERYKSEDDAAKDRLQAKNHLESYAFSLRQSIQDPKISAKLNDGDKKKLEEAVNGAIKWMESHPSGEKEQFEAKQKELESVCAPIISQIYGSGGGGGMPGMGGMPGGMGGMGGMPGGMGGMGGGEGGRSGGGGTSSGPKVEEVD